MEEKGATRSWAGGHDLDEDMKEASSRKQQSTCRPVSAERGRTVQGQPRGRALAGSDIIDLQ